MLFSSLTFILAFLPGVFVLYYILRDIKHRNILLAIASVFFYSFGEPRYIILLIFAVVVNYKLTLLAEDSINQGRQKTGKSLYIANIVFNLALLGCFKYIDFLIINLNTLFNLSIPLANIPLPIGISFYTFQIMSYVIDVHRKKVPAQKSLLNLLLYVSLFPQLIAGPIVTYITVEKELSCRPNTINNAANGFRRFIIGLGKKVILANNMAVIIDHYLTFDIISLSTPLAWIGILAYTLQIYFDFSGYSDMAIGIGKMFGFNFLENFNYPYMSKSITEFWRRWHISLGTWFRDYVYIPLGGNRVSKARWLLNIFIVWFLTGFWHGAKWNFVIWGLWYGFFLVLEKLLFAKFLDRLPRLFAWGYTFLVTVFGWVFFRLESWNDIKDYFMVLMGMGHYSSSHVSIEQLGQLYPYYFFVPAILGITPVFHWLYNKALNKLPTTIMLDIYLAIVFIISICFLLIDTYNPFIYFRF